MNNTAGDHGGGLYNFASAVDTKNSLFIGNTAGDDGGGAFNKWFTTLSLTNTTFHGNSTGEEGGAVYTRFLSSCEATNSIFWGDEAAGFEDELGGSGAHSVTYSDVQGGHTGNGNIDLDPAFIDPLGGDLHLGAGSPAIDAANGDVAPVTDMEGRARWDDPAVTDTGTGSPTYVDMGAYERGPTGDPCEGIVCDTPPSNYCADADTLTVYETPGTCTDGICDYTTHTEACQFGCADGACNPDPCEGVSCDTPPSNECADTDNLKVFE
ncbi:MAG: hypothetical protein GY851_32810, partial [bacterium]|nr:hypothetical protein [bacterium]